MIEATDTRFCKNCLLMDQAEEDQKDLKKYLSVIRDEDKTDEKLYEKRLDICRTCDKLMEATCEACGCYVEFRAAIKHGKCPKKKW